MAKYVFLNMPLQGHVNPTLAVAQELVNRGQEVSYYLTEEFRNAVQATGATFRPYESQIPSSRQVTIDTSLSASSMFRLIGIGPRMLEETRYVLPQVMERIRAEQPDAIIYDFLCFWALKVVDELQVPAISTRATYASNEHFSLFEQVRKNFADNPEAHALVAKIRETRAEEAVFPAANFFRVISRVAPLNIVFISREFQPAGETFDERYLFVGPPILPRYQPVPFPFEKLESQRPLLYISLGSMVTNQLAFDQLCFEACAGQPWQVVLSTGKDTDLAQLGTIPENFLLSPSVPQLEILPRTRVFVTHAGTNSVMESLYYGVPMVLIPQQWEQQAHAKRLVDLGAGLLLEKGALTPTTLREAVLRVAQDNAYHEHAHRLQQSTRAAGGQQRAAEAIIQFISSQ